MSAAKFREKIDFFGRKIICSSSSFLVYRPYFFTTLAKIFQHNCPNCTSLVHGRSLSKIIYLRKVISIFIFKNLVEKSDFCQKKSGSSKLHSKCQEERFEKNIFFEKTSSLSNFSAWPKKDQFLGKKLRRVVRIAFYVSRGTFWGKVSLWTD